MVTSSEEAIESVAKGVTKGLYEVGKKDILAWAKKLKNKKLAFIEDPETIKNVKLLTKSEEVKTFRRYVNIRDLDVLFRMGLALRGLEKEPKKYDVMKARITKKFRTSGLHVAYFVQNGLFSQLHTSLSERFASDVVKSEINEIMQNIDKYVVFIWHGDTLEAKVPEVITKIYANSPDTFVISSWKKGSIAICKSIHTKIMSMVKKLYVSKDLKSGNKQIYFLIRNS